jgi:hypothetical protein
VGLDTGLKLKEDNSFHNVKNELTAITAFVNTDQLLN